MEGRREGKPSLKFKRAPFPCLFPSGTGEGGRTESECVIRACSTEMLAPGVWRDGLL